MQVGNNVVEKVSGPSYFCLLSPMKNIFNNYGDIYLPIVMLFGDYHIGYEGFCKDKTNEIYLHKFLQVFNSISTPEKPVNFNTEWYFTEDEYKNISNRQIIENIKNFGTDEKTKTSIK